MKFLDIFSGIGAFRFGLESAGHECIGFCEKDRYARASYKAIHDTEGEVEFHDITKVTDKQWRELRGKVDIITSGFPCQPFTTAGKRGGFNDTRGTLFFEIARATKEIQPSILLLENVKTLFSHDSGRTFGTIIQTLDELGYVTEWSLFNSKNWGVPQNRKRVFIVAVRKDLFKEPILFDLNKQEELNGLTVELKDILEQDIGDELDIADNLANALIAGFDSEGLHIREATKQGYAVARLNDSVSLQYPTSKTRRGRVGKQIANTLQTGEANQGVIRLNENNEFKIRKLTVLEYWRLQGFSDLSFDKASEVSSNTQMYKQAGNSVTINVVRAIAKRLVIAEHKED